MEAIETTNEASNSTTEPIIIPAQQLAAIKSTSKEVRKYFWYTLYYCQVGYEVSKLNKLYLTKNKIKQKEKVEGWLLNEIDTKKLNMEDNIESFGKDD